MDYLLILEDNAYPLKKQSEKYNQFLFYYLCNRTQLYKSMTKIKSGFKGETAIVLPKSVIDGLTEDILGKELHITDMGYYPKAGFHHRERSAREAEQFILIYCLEGNGWFELEGRTEKIAPGQFFILPKGKPHRYGSARVDPWTIYWIHFNGSKASFFAEGFDKPAHLPFRSDSRIEERLRLFEEIFATLSRGYSTGNLYYSITCLFHFLGTLKFLGEYRESNRTGGVQTGDIIDETIHFMRENIARRLSLSEIAAHAGISGSHLSALFHKRTGYSPLQYLCHLKIQEACHYLDFTDMKINQICHKTGYDDAFYFTRLFTKIRGMSPSGYRAQKKG